MQTRKSIDERDTIHCVEIEDRIYLRLYLLVSNGWGGWSSIGAISGLAGGLLSVPVGLLIWATKLIAPVEIAPTLNVLSNILFGLTLPLLALGACCLDLLESRFPTATPTEREARW